MVILLIVILLFVLYSLLIISYWLNWKSLSPFIPAEKRLQLKLSVVIPARNEEANIGKLLAALEKQTYPRSLFEVIVVDDHSTDATAEVVRKFTGVQLISLNEDNINSFKKKAIEKGIQAATGEMIVTTDADCLPQPPWLEMIVACKEKNDSLFIAAPVSLHTENKNLLTIFQQLDFLVLQGITAIAVSKKQFAMCNGANLAYDRKAFYEVGGFDQVDQIASGDDMLLMHKIWKKYPNRLHYLFSTDAITSTEPMHTWKNFFNQRIRWASKARFYEDKKIFLVLLLVYLFNFSFLALAIAGFINPQYWILLLILWVAKTIIELPFVTAVATFFGHRSLLKYFFFFQPLHIFYTIVAGLFGQFGKYEWKGRRVK